MDLDYLHTSLDSETEWMPRSFCIPSDETPDPIDLMHWCPLKPDRAKQYNPRAISVGVPKKATYYLQYNSWYLIQTYPFCSNSHTIIFRTIAIIFGTQYSVRS